MALDPAWVAAFRRALNEVIPEYMKDLAANVGTDLVRDIVADNRSQPSSGGSMLPVVKVIGAGRVVDGDSKPTAGNGSGWASSPELRQPDGLRHIDAMLDEEDRQWRAQRIRELAGTAHSLALAQAAAEAEQKATQAEQQPKGKGGQK
jgi:hypothetical protein